MAYRENNKNYHIEETTSPLVSTVLERGWARLFLQVASALFKGGNPNKNKKAF